MKKVILEISDCKNCPFYRYDRFDFQPPWPLIMRYCQMTDKPLDKVDDNGVAIPEWCPLDDARDFELAQKVRAVKNQYRKALEDLK